MSHTLCFISEAVGRRDWRLVLDINKNMESEDALWLCNVTYGNTSDRFNSVPRQCSSFISLDRCWDFLLIEKQYSSTHHKVWLFPKCLQSPWTSSSSVSSNSVSAWVGGCEFNLCNVSSCRMSFKIAFWQSHLWPH